MTDVDGKTYVDFAGGIGVNNVGHSHPKVVKAITEQARLFIHTCFHVAMYEPYVALAEKLNTLAPGNFDKMTMFANSGLKRLKMRLRLPGMPPGKLGLSVLKMHSTAAPSWP